MEDFSVIVLLSSKSNWNVVHCWHGSRTFWYGASPEYFVWSPAVNSVDVPM
jgi:hypothetical protein